MAYDLKTTYLRNIKKRSLIRKLRVQKFLAKYLSEGTLELASKGNNSWVMLLPDASNQGKFRHQAFNRDGMMSHSTFNTIEEAIADAVGLGYKRVANGTLEEVACTQRWAQGMEITFLIDQVNRSQITHAQFNELAREVQNRYA